MRSIFALAIAAVTTAFAPSNAATVILADRYLDVASGRYVEHPAIFVGDDGRITGIADARTIRMSAGSNIIDLHGETLVPGLIDMHVHLTSLAEIGGYRSLQYTDNFWSVVGVANAKKTLDAGFTTVRNVGSSNFDDVALKQAIDGKWLEGPRIVPAAYAIGATGGHCDDNSLPPSLDKKQSSVIDSPRRRPRQGALASQIWRGGDQDLRHRWRVLARRQRRRAATQFR